MAIAALVLGIVGAALTLTCFWYPVLGQIPSIILGILAIIFGVLGKKKQPEKEKQAKAGLILGIVSLVLGILVMIGGIIVVAVIVQNNGGIGSIPSFNNNYCK